MAALSFYTSKSKHTMYFDRPIERPMSVQLTSWLDLPYAGSFSFALNKEATIATIPKACTPSRLRRAFSKRPSLQRISVFYNPRPGFGALSSLKIRVCDQDELPVAFKQERLFILFGNSI